MAINTLPATDMVAVGFFAAYADNYTISATETGDFALIELEDLLTGTFTNLLNESYTFKHSPLNAENRFIVHFKPLSVGDNFADMINIYSNNQDVYVTVPVNTRGTVKVYNLVGQEAASVNITDITTKITLDKNAYYVVEVISDGSVVTKKVFVK
ncbi:MAG: T9SS type A sorting domain-containing protein [Bacteroidetes bacterium]|nr:T9SS type A sorting domain-containing protein [Bacteroidota bacterium]